MKLTREIVMNCRNDEENIFYIPDEYEDDFLNIFNKLKYKNNKSSILLYKAYNVNFGDVRESSDINIYPLFPLSTYIINNNKYIIL